MAGIGPGNFLCKGKRMRHLGFWQRMTDGANNHSCQPEGIAQRAV